MSYKPGDRVIWTTDIGVPVNATVLGGPTVITDWSRTQGGWSRALWTVRVRDGSFSYTRVAPQDRLRFLSDPNWDGVKVATCPSCDEPDMIFYNDDYICAWCREHLEDGIVW